MFLQYQFSTPLHLHFAITSLIIYSFGKNVSVFVAATWMGGQGSRALCSFAVGPVPTGPYDHFFSGLGAG
jgi:hypothetical protein